MRTSKHIGIKQKAIQLRKDGYSYNYISKKTDIPKSTLHGWAQGVAFTPNAYTKKTIGNALAASALAKSKIKIADIHSAQKEAMTKVSAVSQRDLFMVGVGLYIGEGTKSHEQVRIINSDPKVVFLAVQWFVGTLNVPLRNIYIRLHVYPDCDLRKSMKYWHKETGVPMENFQKASVDRRTDKKMLNYGKLPYGTAHLSVKSHGNKQLGVHLSRLILGMIDEVTNKLRD